MREIDVIAMATTKHRARRDERLMWLMFAGFCLIVAALCFVLRFI